MNTKILIQIENNNFTLNNIINTITTNNILNRLFTITNINNNKNYLTITLKHYLLNNVCITLKFFYKKNEIIVEYKNIKKTLSNLLNKYIYLFFSNKKINNDLIYKLENKLIIYK